MKRVLPFFRGGAVWICLGATPFLYAQAKPQVFTYEKDEFIVSYEKDGENAVKPDDTNANGIPDQVEDLMTQLQAAKILYVEGMGFTDPLKGERFKTVSKITVRFLGPNQMQGNGVAYDEIQRPVPAFPYPRITASVATRVSPSKNCTPAHEYFHLIQNGTCYFKNPWYSEGTARWSEELFLPQERRLPLRTVQANFPMSEADKVTLSDMKYDAFPFFWHPLLRWKGPLKPDVIPSHVQQRLKAMTYVDGSPVVHRYEVIGASFMSRLFRELDRQDDFAYRDRKLERWSEAEQRSKLNDAYFYKAIQAVFRSMP